MDLLLILLFLGGLLGVVVVFSQRNKRELAELKEAEVGPVKKLAFEDVTALGEQLQALDLDLTGQQLDEGMRADYQRALDAYDSAKVASEAITEPEQVRHVTEILEDGRYAIACVRARVAGEPLPTRRPPCFFDPRHGPSVADVAWTPAGGTTREVPACALDAERVRAGAEPDARMVMVGARRVPYWAGGRSYQPYASGYFGGFTPMNWMFAGLLFTGMGGFDALGGIGDGIGDAIGGIGDGFGVAIGDMGDGIGDAFGGIGDAFDGFDF